MLTAFPAHAALLDADTNEARVVGVIFSVVNSAGEEGSAMVVTRATDGEGVVTLRVCQLFAFSLCADYSYQLTGSTTHDGVPEFFTDEAASRVFLTIDNVPGFGALDLDFWSTSPPGLFGGPATCDHETVLGGFAIGSPLNDITLAMVVRGGILGQWRTGGIYCGFMAVDGASAIYGL